MGDATPVADPDPVREHQNETDSEVAQDGPAIWERIRRRLDGHLGIVEVHAHRLLERDLTPQEAITASSAAAALALEFGLLELPSTARLARHLASTFEADVLDATTAVHIAATSEDIRTLFASAIAQHETADASRGMVVVAGDPSPGFDATCWVLASRGFALRTSLGDQGRTRPVGAVVLAERGAEVAAASAAQAIAESWAIPLVVVAATEEVTELRHLSHHAACLLALDTPPGTVVDELVKAVAAYASRPVALLCGTGDGVRAGFSAHGFDTRIVAEPDALLHLRPDGAAVVFGHGVSPAVVADLARVLRALPATRRVPILWHHDTALRHHTVAAAHAGVVATDRIDDSTIAAVHAHLRMSAIDHAEDQSDTGTVLNWAAAQVLIDRSLVAAQRGSDSVAFASIDIGTDVTDAALPSFIESFGREFRRGDVVCLRSDRNLIVALQGVSRRVATNRMAELMDRYHLAEGGSRVGVAVFPSDGRSAAELAVAADGAQALARTHHGPAVVSTTWRPETERAADVLVVDPDPVVAHMLATAFEERGLRTDASHDGREALVRLTGDGEQRLPRLVLLEMDTPGLDGLSLVRRLRSAGVLGQTNVLLMTGRTTDADIRLAFELGVADIVRKPFSTTLLQHRAHRLLEDQQ